MEAFEQLIKQIAPNLYAYRDRFFTSFQATFEMFAKAGIIAFVIGMFFGVLLVITRKGGVRENIIVYQIANILINVFRSIPFIILLVMLFDVTRFVMGTAIGTRACIFPLFISAFRRADELATAMECRCYRGGSGRTKLKQLRFQLRDILTFALGAAVLAGVIVLRSYGL